MRVSSKEQELEGFSLEAQERNLREYCKRVGLHVVKVFFISETASKVEQRTIFSAAIKYLIAHQVPNLVCEKVDRLTRNFKDTVMVEDWLASDENRRLHLPKSSLVLRKDSPSQDKFVWGMHVVVAKNYTDNLSEEVRKGQLEKLRSGWYPGTPPFGYVNTIEQGKRIQVIDPALQPLMVKMFEMAATKQFTMKSLGAEMARQGLLLDGHPLTASMTHRLLRNPYYIGVIVWNKQQFPGSHDPMISVELFEKVQRALSRNPTLLSKYRKHCPVFQGLVVCGDCEGLIIWETRKGHWYGKCPKSRNCSRDHYIREEQVTAQVVALMQRLQAPRPRLAAWLRQKLQETLDTEVASRRLARTALETESKKILSMLETLYDDRLSGRISPEMYDSKATSLHAQRAGVTRQLKGLEGEDMSYLDACLNFVELTQNAAEEYSRSKSADRKRELIGQLFDSLTLSGDLLRGDVSQRTQWILTDVMPLASLKNTKIGPADFGSGEPINADAEVPHPIWLGLRNSIRTIFA